MRKKSGASAQQNNNAFSNKNNANIATNRASSSLPNSQFTQKKPKEESHQRLGSLLEKYEIIETIGAGTYGEVFQAVERGTDKKVAIKLFHKTKEGEGISLTAYRELMLLNELKHENIINLCNICISPEEKSISLILDYAEYDLSEIIRFHGKRTELIPPYTVKSVMWQVLNSIHFLHSNWVCHRDMKPSNILIMGKGPQMGMIKIADFGLARIYQAPLRPLFENGVVVTIWYRAPELLFGSKHYTKAVDMWAIGCIFSELLTNQALFPGKEKDPKNPNLFQDIQLDRIFKVIGKPSIDIWPDLAALPDWQTGSGNMKWKDTIIEREWHHYPIFTPDNAMKLQQKSYPDINAYNLLCKMLEYDPQKRISASDALDHPYFKQDPAPGKNVFQMDYPSRAQLRKTN